MLSISLPNTIKVHRIAVLVQIPKACAGPPHDETGYDRGDQHPRARVGEQVKANTAPCLSILGIRQSPPIAQDRSASGKRDSSAQRQSAQKRILARNAVRGDRNVAANARQLRAPWPSPGNLAVRKNAWWMRQSIRKYSLPSLWVNCHVSSGPSMALISSAGWLPSSPGVGALPRTRVGGVHWS